MAVHADKAVFPDRLINCQIKDSSGDLSNCPQDPYVMIQATANGGLPLPAQVFCYRHRRTMKNSPGDVAEIILDLLTP
jgi:hypothetical protein